MKQVVKFYITSFLKNQTYFTPILILFLQANHLNYREIFWVFTIGSILSFLVEIPSGVFADLFGKRKSIIISKFGIFLSYLFFGFSDNFIMFVISQCLFEFGNSFRTGTETAYIYDYLKQNKNTPGYTEVKGKQKFWARIGESLASVTSGFLATIFGFNWVFLIASIPAFLNFVLVLTWEKIKESNNKVSIKNSITHAKNSFCKLCKNKSLLRVTLNILIFASALAALQKFIQPYMKDANIPIQWFGIIYSISLGITAISVRYSYKLEKKFGTKNTINFISLFAVLPLLILGLKYISLFGVLLFFLVVLIENIRSPIANNEFHNLIESKQRATLGSILALGKSIGKIIILPIAGYFADMYSIYTAILVLAVILFFNGIIFYLRKDLS
jgi:MFS family permease